MTQGFYEILGLESAATTAQINAAYHERLAELVRRLRAARRQGADVTILEGQERSLREAMQVLSEPLRRQRYDAYRTACREGMPTNAEALWGMAKTSLVDPVAIAALDVLRTSTDLDIGNPFPSSPQPRKWVARPPTPPRSRPDPSLESTEQIERPVPPPPPPARPEPSVAAPPVAADPEPAVTIEEEPMKPIEPTPVPMLDDIPSIAARFGTDGRFIHAVRELRKRTLEDLAEETRISLRYLYAIESNDFDALPSSTFVRGYVKEIARALHITEVDVVEGYMALFSRDRG